MACHAPTATTIATKQTVRNYLTLKRKVEVIKQKEKDLSMTQRSLAELFDCGRTQIAHILKNKDSIMALMLHEAEYIQEKYLECLSMEKSMKHCINGMLLLVQKIFTYPDAPEKAKLIAEQLGKPDF